MSTQCCLSCATPLPSTARACPACGASRLAVPGNATIGLLNVGSRLAGGKYAVGQMLGRGGFGITYLGADNRLVRPIALKEFFPAGAVRHGSTVVPPATLGSNEYAAARLRFLQEAQVLARFHHSSIVAVHDVFQENATAYMVMEYLRGTTLAQVIEQRGTALPEAQIVALALPLAAALDLIHAANLLHRDIKPENIVLVTDAASPRPVLIDFGAAREFVRGKTIKQSVVLTPGYAPLEQYGALAQRGPYTDIYAFAATLYHLATGHAPTAAIDRAVGMPLTSPRTLNPKLSPIFSRALLYGLEMQANRRPQSASEFVAALTKPVTIPGATPRSKRQSHAAGSPATIPPSVSIYLDRVREIARQLESRPASTTSGGLRCPVCRGATMIEPAHATGRVRCPVCRIAGLDERVPTAELTRCPACHTDQLIWIKPEALLPCPACRMGFLTSYARRRWAVFNESAARCDLCHADFSYRKADDLLTLRELPNTPGHLDRSLLGKTKSRSEWIKLSGRSIGGMLLCQSCHAELDKHADGSYELVAVERNPQRVPPAHRGQRRSLSAWAKIAHGLPAAEGTHVCPACAAQFDATEPDRLTLLRAPYDPFGIGKRYLRKSYATPIWRGIAAGMRHPLRSDCICPACTTELEADPRQAQQLRLVAFKPDCDPYGVGRRYNQQPALHRADWQRIAEGRPRVQEEQQLRAAAQHALWAALLAGEYVDSEAARTYPARPSSGERVLLTITADHYRQTRDGVYPYDSGTLWVTTRKLLFQGSRANVIVPLDKISEYKVQSVNPTIDLVALRRADRARMILFTNPATLNLPVDRWVVSLPWSAGRLVELIERLRRGT